MYITFPGAEMLDRPTGERAICPKCRQSVALIDSPSGAVLANHFALPPPQRGQICDQQKIKRGE